MENGIIIKIGPMGKKIGTIWDEKGHDKIVRIFISHDDLIYSIQFQYLENGTLVFSDCHGSSNGLKFDVVKLKFPSEYITCISGYKDPWDNQLVSLTIGTNCGQYGPFGGQFKSHQKEYCLKLGQDPEFYGFHGTADINSVKSIGVYIKPAMVLDSDLTKNERSGEKMTDNVVGTTDAIDKEENSKDNENENVCSSIDVHMHC